MAKKPKQSSGSQYVPLTEEERAAKNAAYDEWQRQRTATQITAQVEQFAKEEAERQRPKNYQDLLNYARQSFASDPNAEFPKGAQISPFETIAPYYGDAAETELAAAAEYAAQLREQQNSMVKIDPYYYDQIKEKIPVVEKGYSASYLVKPKIIQMPSPENEYRLHSGLTEKELAENNYGTVQQNLKSLQDAEGKMQTYRDALEHESVHAIDKYANLPYPYSSKYSPNPESHGYMGRGDHLVVGLSKVQREHYAMTGKRFETPDEYKSFILNLAGSENPEEAISPFSEEAKRTLRAQISNAKYMPEIYEKIKEYEKLPALKRMFEETPRTKGSVNRFEESAQLIPALVEYRQASQPTA
jgi:hypothetical protein